MKNNWKKKGIDALSAFRAMRPGTRILIVCAVLAVIAVVSALGFALRLRNSAYAAKDDLKAVIVCLAQQDAEGAEEKTAELEKDAARMEKLLSSPMGRIAAHTPGIRTEMAAVRKISAVVNSATAEFLRPCVTLMREYPLSGLRKAGGGLDYSLAGVYIDFAAEKRQELIHLSDELAELAAMPYGRLESRIGGLRKDMETLRQITAFASDMVEDLLKPGIDLLRSHPSISQGINQNGVDLRMLSIFLDFAEEKLPYIRTLLEKLSEIDLERFDNHGELQAVRGKVDRLLELYEQSLDYQPLIRAFIGSGEDKLYLFAAQNSSEIRSSGGFPGSVGTIRIRDGVLQIEDFKPVNTVLSFNGSPETQISYNEIMLFGDWFLAPRDADFCPDFERVAEIWAVAYREMNGEEVDGVISATPAIIQRLLSVAGAVELSDGTVLDGTNATKALEYDLYYRYFGYGSLEGQGNEITDTLFAEAAKKVMAKTMGSIGIQSAPAYFELLKESAKDRTLMLWMADEDEQELVRRVGLDCGLNRDPSHPQAGIYFALTNPGRMGWFLDMEPSAELLETHEDGSRTYAVHLDMRNVMTQEEYNSASRYISGKGASGVVTGYLYLFAPAGGTIGTVKCSDRSFYFYPGEYHGLELQYYQHIFINYGFAITIDYTITTAPGEQEDLSFSMTPTLQAYR